MSILKAKKFGSENELVEFVAANNIAKSEIFTITQYGGYYTISITGNPNNTRRDLFLKQSPALDMPGFML